MDFVHLYTVQGICCNSELIYRNKDRVIGWKVISECSDCFRRISGLP